LLSADPRGIGSAFHRAEEGGKQKYESLRDKEILFNSAAFASQAKRAVKQYKKYVIEFTN